MTFRERLKLEHPDLVGDSYFGGCKGCPSTYGYLPDPISSNGDHFNKCLITCAQCWDREMPTDFEKIEDADVLPATKK